METKLFEISICRLCLGSDPKIKIFQDELYDKITLCCNVKIQENDSFSSEICINCLESITKAVDFRNMCEANDKILWERKDFIKTENSFIKEEYVDYDDDYDNSDLITGTIELEILNQNSAENADIKGKKKRPSRRRKKVRDENYEPDCKWKKKSSLCPYCGLHIEKSCSKFSRHVREHLKSSERTHKCEECGKMFKTKHNLKSHVITHSDRRDYSCEICGKLFRFKSDVKKHMRGVHLKIRKVECDICKARLADKSCLKIHMRTHTLEYNYECEICNKKLSSLGGYKKHQMLHTGEKPFKCQFCDSTFRLEKTKQEHERLHTGETPYKCPCCDRGYAQLCNMKSHFKHNHKNVNFDEVYKGLRRSKPNKVL